MFRITVTSVPSIVISIQQHYDLQNCSLSNASNQDFRVFFLLLAGFFSSYSLTNTQTDHMLCVLQRWTGKWAHLTWMLFIFIKMIMKFSTKEINPFLLLIVPLGFDWKEQSGSQAKRSIVYVKEWSRQSTVIRWI